MHPVNTKILIWLSSQNTNGIIDTETSLDSFSKLDESLVSSVKGRVSKSMEITTFSPWYY